jgi:hypothetical protein
MSEPVIKEYREEPYQADADGCWPSVRGPLVPGVMMVLYVNGVAEMVEYLCPCGCGMPCPTFMPNDHRHRSADRHLWEFSRGPNGPTLTPSVRHTGGCKSHYNITDGKTVWHEDSGK